MSDITIPGVNSNINTAKIIEALMEPERVKIENVQNEIDNLNNEKKVWQDISVRMSRLQDSAKLLYGFENPFNNKIASSENDSILTATATREAVEEVKEFTILQTAKVDRFMSDSLSDDFEVDDGVFKFQIGEEEIEFNFNGGSLNELADNINRKAGDFLNASIVNDTADTKVIIIESKITGAENPLIFLDGALDFGLKAGILEQSVSMQRDIEINQSAIAPWEKTLSPDFITINEGEITLRPQGEFKIPINPPLALNPNVILELDISVKNLTADEYTVPSRPEGPDIPLPGGIDFGGLHIENERSDIDMPAWTPPPLPEVIEDMQIMYMGSNGNLIPLTVISEGTQSYKIPLGELSGSIDTLYFRNRNTYKEITISNINIYDPTLRGDSVAKNPLTTAEDALIEMDGITITRDTNEIDDLIPGVNITLKSESDEPVKLNIEVDREGIKEAIIEFVGFYNQLITQIDILTRNDTGIIENTYFLEDSDRELAEQNLGILQGDITLSQMKSRLRTIISESYFTSGDLRLLAQIGISTDATQPGSGTGLNINKLRGYLEIDETKFDEVLEREPELIKELFGMDSDGDYVIDKGIAYTINTYIQPYITIGGILPVKFGTYDTTIARRTDDIDDLNRYLVDYEQQLRVKYGNMEGMLNQLEQSSRALDNFSNSYNNNR